MSSISHPPAEAVPERRRHELLMVREMWASPAIVAIWLAVLFTAVYGPNIETHGAGGDYSRVPSAVAVALFASLATWAVAKYGLGHRRKDTN
jgi:peptidoglycan/LPS O-acetylase OafA/YrhL